MPEDAAPGWVLQRGPHSKEVINSLRVQVNLYIGLKREAFQTLGQSALRSVLPVHKRRNHRDSQVSVSSATGA